MQVFTHTLKRRVTCSILELSMTFGEVHSYLYKYFAKVWGTISSSVTLHYIVKC